MAALDNNTTTPNTTDQVIITDKDTNDEYDRRLINISNATDEDFKEIWEGNIKIIKRYEEGHRYNIKKQHQQNKIEQENLERCSNVIKLPYFWTDESEETKKMILDCINETPNIIKMNTLQIKASLIAIKIGNAIIKKHRVLAETLLCDLRIVLDENMELAELVSNDCQGESGGPDQGFSQIENEGLYLVVCKRNKVLWETISFRVKVLVNEYYRL